MQEHSLGYLMVIFYLVGFAYYFLHYMIEVEAYSSSPPSSPITFGEVLGIHYQSSSPLRVKYLKGYAFQ